MIIGLPRKLNKIDIITHQVNKGKLDEYTNLINDISKNLEEEEQTKKQFYLKKSKLNMTKS